MAALMPFGKFCGLELNRLPLSYLRWIRNNIPVTGWLREALDTILAGRPYLDALDLERLVHLVVKDAEAQLRAYKQAGDSDGHPPRTCRSG